MSYRLNNLSELFTWIAEEELPRRYDAGIPCHMCHCAERAARKGLCSTTLQHEAEKLLTERLRQHPTYGVWLRENHPDIADLPSSDFHGRVAWARALAEEFRE